MEDMKDRKQNGLNGDKQRGRDRSSSPGRRRRSRSPISRQSTERSAGDSSRALRRVFVANFPFDVKLTELKGLFRDKVGNVTYCRLFETKDKKSRGLVEFQDSASARKAIDILHRYVWKGRELVVKEDSDVLRDRFGRIILSSNREREGEGDNRSDGYDVNVGANSQSDNTYGLSPEFLQSLGVKGPLNNRVFVGNLDYKVGGQKLEEILKLAGNVTNVKLYTDRNSNSEGQAIVEFGHPVEAVQAISMFHNQKLFGRPLSVRMDRYECDETNDTIPPQLPTGLEDIGKGLGIGGRPLNIQKSMLSTSASTNIQSQPPPVPEPMTALSVLTNLAANLQQLSTIVKSLSQLSSNASVNQEVKEFSINNTTGLNIPGFVDRSLSGLGPTTVLTLSNLSASSTGLSSGLSSFANTAQNVCSQSLSGVSHMQISASHNPHNPQNTAINNPNNGNLSVDSTYERELRADRNRTQICELDLD